VQYLYGVRLAVLRFSVELEHRHGLAAADLVGQGYVHGLLAPLRRYDVALQARRVRSVQLAVRKPLKPFFFGAVHTRPSSSPPPASTAPGARESQTQDLPHSRRGQARDHVFEHEALVVELRAVVHCRVVGGVDCFLKVDNRCSAWDVEANDGRGRLEAETPFLIALGANAMARDDRAERVVRGVRSDFKVGPEGVRTLTLHVRCVGIGRHEPFLGVSLGEAANVRTTVIVELAVFNVRQVDVSRITNGAAWQCAALLLLVNVLRRLDPGRAHSGSVDGVHYNLW